MPLPAFLLPALSIGAQLYGISQQHKAGDKQDEYTQRMEQQAARERRRAALARAVGANDVTFMPQEQEKAPDLGGYSTRAGLANIGSMTISDLLAHPEWFKSANKPVPGALPYDISGEDRELGHGRGR